MNHFQIFSRPDHFERITFLGYWIFSLIIWSFIMNISLVIVIIFGIIGYHLVCKPLAFLLHHIQIALDIMNSHYSVQLSLPLSPELNLQTLLVC